MRQVLVVAFLMIPLSAIAFTPNGTNESPAALNGVAELEIDMDLEPGMNQGQVSDAVRQQLVDAGITPRSSEHRLIITVRTASSLWDQVSLSDPTLPRCSVAVSVIARLMERAELIRGERNVIPDATVAVWTESNLIMAHPDERDAAVFAAVQKTVKWFLDSWHQAQQLSMQPRKPCVTAKETKSQ